jgi:hypothetical protein
MKKIGVLIFILILSFGIFVSAENESTQSGASGEIEKYAETAGVWLLKFQEFFMGALAFFSFGAFNQSGTLAFAQFLLVLLVFLTTYSILDMIPFFSSKTKVPFALIFSILSFSFINVGDIYALLGTYEAMGVIIGVALPVLIVLSFTFRIYQKAYAGESKNSPFFAEVFNLIFLIFFGIFFIRFGKAEEGIVSWMRVVSGWILIIMGIAQFLLYKLLAKFLFNQGERLVIAAKEIRKRKARENQKDSAAKAAIEKRASI